MRRMIFTLCAVSLLTGAGSGHGGETGKIAFMSGRDGNLEIYVMEADGTRQTNLTRNPARDMNPAWSPDGSKIAFVSERDGSPAIFVMEADGTKPTNLTGKLSLGRGVRPTWSPDGRRIAFVADQDGNPTIYAMNADGTRPINLTGKLSLAKGVRPVWSPDGTRIAFVADQDGSPVVYAVNADGAGLTGLTGDTKMSRYTGTAWSPDGSRILCSGAIMNEGDVIYLVAADGSGAINFSAIVPLNFEPGRGFDMVPTWSPDGTRISFAATRHTQGASSTALYAVQSDGTTPVRLTEPGPALILSSAWSPDGKRIAFRSSLRQENTMLSDLHVAHADGAKPVNLTKGAGELGSFIWSPDGTKIVFEISPGSQTSVTQEKTEQTSSGTVKTAVYRSGGGKREIYVINADGTKLVQLTNTGKDMSPVWRPQPRARKAGR